MFYVIIDDNFYTADNRGALHSIYPNEEIKELPIDFEPGKYIVHNDKLILNPEWDKIHITERKTARIEENDTLRDTALLGGVTYNNVLFDSDTDQKVNLLATVGMMSDTDTVVWYGMDNQGLLCTKADLMAIGGLITELHSFCWNNNAYIKEQIENAESIEEVENIEINYERG